MCLNYLQIVVDLEDCAHQLGSGHQVGRVMGPAAPGMPSAAFPVANEVTFGTTLRLQQPVRNSSRAVRPGVVPLVDVSGAES